MWEIVKTDTTIPTCYDGVEKTMAPGGAERKNMLLCPLEQNFCREMNCEWYNRKREHCSFTDAVYALENLAEAVENIAAWFSAYDDDKPAQIDFEIKPVDIESVIGTERFSLHDDQG